MYELRSSALVFVILLACSAFGLLVKPFLSEHHRSRETVELVQVVVTMLVTFTALVLGLQTNSVKANFDEVAGELRTYSVELIQLDMALREYGDAAASIRTQLRDYTASAIATTWTEEAPPPGDYYLKQVPRSPIDSRIESNYLGGVLRQIQGEISALHPSDELHERLQAECAIQIRRVIEQRWKVIETGGNSISLPFYVVLIFWLGIVFAAFGLNAPGNILAYVTIGLAALSIASVMFVLLDLDRPFGGIFSVSSQPMRDALAHMLS